MFILTIDYSKNFTTTSLPTIAHMVMLVVKFNHIQIYGQVMDLSNDWQLEVRNIHRLDFEGTMDTWLYTVLIYRYF